MVLIIHIFILKSGALYFYMEIGQTECNKEWFIEISIIGTIDISRKLSVTSNESEFDFAN